MHVWSVKRNQLIGLHCTVRNSKTTTLLLFDGIFKWLFLFWQCAYYKIGRSCLTLC